MNLPGQKIQDIYEGYCRLVIPWSYGRWIAYNKTSGFCVTAFDGFHNCTRTGIY